MDVFAIVDDCLEWFDMRRERVWETGPENGEGTIMTIRAYVQGSVLGRLAHGLT